MAEKARASARTTWARIAIVGILGFVSGCATETGAVESPVTEQQAIEMAENALEAFNTGDYALWTTDWSEAMRSAIDAEAFQAFRSQFHASLGDYVSIRGVEGGPGADSGTYRWTFDIEFAKASYTMWFGFKEGSPLIEGVSFEDPSP